MINDGLDQKSREKIIRLCKSIFPKASIWIYGSRARGDYQNDSDIDLLLDAYKKLDFFEIAELKDILAATKLPYKIDIIDFSSISDSEFKQQIDKEKQLWQR